MGLLDKVVTKDEVRADARAAREEMVEAAEAVGTLAKAASAFVVGWFRTKLGYQLHDPDQNVVISSHEPTEAKMTPWLAKQIEEGHIEEVGPPAGK